jgi:aryl-alcohol dehydrogenase-like predicted oxidoreductase
VLAQGEDIVPIPGTKHRNYLEENIAASEITLSTEELASIEQILPKGSASGGRYPAAMMELIKKQG